MSTKPLACHQKEEVKGSETRRVIFGGGGFAWLVHERPRASHGGDHRKTVEILAPSLRCTGIERTGRSCARRIPADMFDPRQEDLRFAVHDPWLLLCESAEV